MVLCDLFLAFGICCHLTTFTDDLKAKIQEFSEQSKIDGNQTEFIKTFHKIVEFHSTAKQLSFNEELFIKMNHSNLIRILDLFLINAKLKNTRI